jgi:hypothetical protein
MRNNLHTLQAGYKVYGFRDERYHQVSSSFLTSILGEYVMMLPATVQLSNGCCAARLYGWQVYSAKKNQHNLHSLNKSGCSIFDNH